MGPSIDTSSPLESNGQRFEQSCQRSHKVSATSAAVGDDRLRRVVILAAEDTVRSRFNLEKMQQDSRMLTVELLLTSQPRKPHARWTALTCSTPAALTKKMDS
jgi:hypothetical protein